MPSATCRSSRRRASACPTATTTWSPTTPSSRRARAVRGLPEAGLRARAPQWRRCCCGAPVIELETALAQGQWTKVENRDPIKSYNRVDVGGLTPAPPAWTGPPGLGAAGFPAGRPMSSSRQPSYLGPRCPARGPRRCRRGRPTCARTACSALRSAISAKDSSTRASHSPARCCAGATENRPRWKRGVRFVDCVDRRGAGQALRGQYFPPETRRAWRAGRQPAGRLPREHRLARLDEPGHQAGGAGKLARVHAEDRLPEKLARLRRAGDPRATT